MKKLAFILSLLMLLCKLSWSQPYNEIKTALTSGNVNALAEHFDDHVTLVVNSQNSNVSSYQAKLLLNNFFNSNKPYKFTEENSGASNYDGINYLVGKLETSANTFRVYILIRPSKSSGYFIKEIRFE